MKYRENKPIMRALKLPVLIVSELKYSLVFDAMALISGIARTKINCQLYLALLSRD